VYEFIAILAGIPVGFLIRQIDQPRLRWASLVVISLVAGFMVSALAGELADSIGFAFFDALQVAAGAAVTYVLVSRYRTNTLR
jgi:hypothetical protein